MTEKQKLQIKMEIDAANARIRSMEKLIKEAHANICNTQDMIKQMESVLAGTPILS